MLTFPVTICRHHEVEWLGSRVCRCLDCGKVGTWIDDFVVWQRRVAGARASGEGEGADGPSAADQRVLVG